MATHIKIGTRGSKLAQLQVQQVGEQKTAVVTVPEREATVHWCQNLTRPPCEVACVTPST